MSPPPSSASSSLTTVSSSSLPASSEPSPSEQPPGKGQRTSRSMDSHPNSQAIPTRLTDSEMSPDSSSASTALSTVSHLFNITPHDQHLIKEWAWKNRTVLAASSAAVCSVLSGFPFDSVKTRMQTHSYNSIMDCVRKTYAEERLGGFFRGMIPPLITVSIIKSISFSVYEGSKVQFRTMFPDKLQGDTIPSLIGLTFLSGSVAGTVVAMMSSPLELVKLQRQLEKLIAMHARKEAEITSLTGDALLREGLATEKKHKTKAASLANAASAATTSTSAATSSQSGAAAASASASASGAKSVKVERHFTHGSISQHGAAVEQAGSSSWRTAKEIMKRKGIFGLYKGAHLQVGRDLLGTGIYFSSYETIKRLMSETIEHIRPHHHASGVEGTTTTTQLKGPGPMVHFLAGGLCGVFSWLVVFPIDLVKSVIQKEVLAANPKYSGAIDCARDIVRREGVRGLYRGLSVTCYRAMPIHSLNFLVYEAVMDYVKRASGHATDGPQYPTRHPQSSSQQQSWSGISRQPVSSTSSSSSSSSAP